jgi:6-phosphogluconolactonase
MSHASPDPEVVVLPDPEAFVAASAERIARRCREAAEERGECAVALTGGTTPRPIYARLARDPYRRTVPWDRVRLFWGDERCVPPDDPRSNFRMAQETLLQHAPIPPARVHRMPAERGDLAAAARDYAEELAAYLPQAPDGVPRFDLVLLGLGEDAHVASLFPGAPVLHETRRTVVAYYVPEVNMHRMTLTVPVLNHAAEVCFLVSGAQKADAVWRALEGPPDPERVPAQLIRPSASRAVWLLDAAAASRLSSRRASPRAPSRERGGGG